MRSWFYFIRVQSETMDLYVGELKITQKTHQLTKILLTHFVQSKAMRFENHEDATRATKIINAQLWLDADVVSRNIGNANDALDLGGGYQTLQKEQEKFVPLSRYEELQGHLEEAHKRTKDLRHELYIAHAKLEILKTKPKVRSVPRNWTYEDVKNLTITEQIRLYTSRANKRRLETPPEVKPRPQLPPSPPAPHIRFKGYKPGTQRKVWLIVDEQDRLVEEFHGTWAGAKARTNQLMRELLSKRR